MPLLLKLIIILILASLGKTILDYLKVCRSKKINDPVKLASIFSNSNDVCVKSEVIQNPCFDKNLVIEIAQSGFNSKDDKQRSISNLAISLIEDESVLKSIYRQIKAQEPSWYIIDTIKAIAEQTNDLHLLKEIETSENPDARKLAKIAINRITNLSTK